MMRSTDNFRTRLPALALAAAMAALGLGPDAALGHPVRIGLRSGASPSLVLCRPARLSVWARPGSDGLVRPAGGNPFFAPTYQAMFFSRPDDRCAWHGDRRAKG